MPGQARSAKEGRSAGPAIAAPDLVNSDHIQIQRGDGHIGFRRSQTAGTELGQNFGKIVGADRPPEQVLGVEFAELLILFRNAPRDDALCSLGGLVAGS